MIVFKREHDPRVYCASGLKFLLAAGFQPDGISDYIPEE
jgi:hypothetical protein